MSSVNKYRTRKEDGEAPLNWEQTTATQVHRVITGRTLWIRQYHRG